MVSCVMNNDNPCANDVLHRDLARHGSNRHQVVRLVDKGLAGVGLCGWIWFFEKQDFC